MDLFQKEDLKQLLDYRNDPCVSIYLPTHRVGRATMQDPIRLKNLLGEAEEALTGQGMRSPDAQELLQPGRDLLNDSDFWQHQSDGLVVFLGENLAQNFRLPLDFKEELLITNRFHLKPLLPMLSGDGRFFVLALSLNEVRLLQGTRYTVDEVDLEGVPTSIAEALWYDDPERQQQWHTGTSSSSGQGGERSAMYHGHGEGTNDEKSDILRFFQQVNSGISELLPENSGPLVLAGVEYLLPIYGDANTYHYLAESGIVGNPDELKAAELHQQAWEIVEPIFANAQQQAADRYRKLAGNRSKEASSDLRTVVKAAAYGGVETLFVDLEVKRWGHFNREANQVIVNAESEAGDMDLLDFAAAQTLTHSGTVFAVPSDLVPGNGDLAAIFRYPFE
jgi:hypothetical protein